MNNIKKCIINSLFLDEVTDAEIKDWAAKTIQTSFREYKRRQNWVKVQHANTFIVATKKASASKKASLKKKESSTSQSSELEAGKS